MVIQTFEDNKREMLLSIKKFKNTFPKPKEKKKKNISTQKKKEITTVLIFICRIPLNYPVLQWHLAVVVASCSGDRPCHL